VHSEMSATARAKRMHAAAMLRHASKAPVFDTDDLMAAWQGRGGSSAPSLEGPKVRLSTLALAVQMDGFKKVKEMMDTMVQDLKEEQQEEVKFKAYCTEEMNKNEKILYSTKHTRKDLELKIREMEIALGKLVKDIKDVRSQMAEIETQIHKASQEREAANAEYQKTMKDQHATQEVLKVALRRLEDFYKKGKGKVAFIQRHAHAHVHAHGQPVKFNKYKENAGSSPVMSMIEEIIEESVVLTKEAVAGERQAQADYEQFVKDSNELLADFSKAVISKMKATAKSKLQISEADSELQGTIDELLDLTKTQADLSKECDWLVKNFDKRQRARAQEMSAIREAKGILSGS